MDKKENTFAKEVQNAKISPAEEMRRNQSVHLITLRSEKMMLASDRAHLMMQAGRMTDRHEAITLLPDCECKTASLPTIGQRIEKLNEAIKASGFNGVSEMTLDALERLADLTPQSDGSKEERVG